MRKSSLLYSSIILLSFILAEGCDNSPSVVCDGSLSMSLLLTPTDCGEQTGKITISPSGGISPYTFTINQSGENATGIFENLSSGAHLVEVTDAEGCTEKVETEITTGLTYNSNIKPIIFDNCAVTGCHVIGSTAANFTINSVVLGRIDNIKELTQSKTMPPDTSGLSLSQEEIDLIGCWVDDGGIE